MKTASILLLAFAATPATAQHAAHDMAPSPAMDMKMNMNAPKAKAKAAAKRGSATKPRARPSSPAAKPSSRAVRRRPAHPKPGASPAAVDAGHDMTGMNMPATPGSSAGSEPMPSGHDMPGMDASHAVAHPGQDLSAIAEPPAPPVAPPPPASFAGPLHAADQVYGREAMASAREDMHAMHGDIRTHRVLIDQAEMRLRPGRDGWFLNGEAWYGGDLDRLRIRAEGEGDLGRAPDRAELQALWSHAANPWFNLQAGFRYDIRPGTKRAWLTAGLQGVAPYGIDVETAIFLSAKGELTARVEGEYDLRLTQKLILQPRVELDLSAQNAPSLRLGSGLSTADAGIRLRYQIVPEFAPYVGLGYERAFGNTAELRRTAGQRSRGLSALAGVRLWF
jgi:copper resistance protein B